MSNRLPKDVEVALALVLDGIKEHELQEITGLPTAICEKIWKINSDLRERYGNFMFSSDYFDLT